MGILLKIARKSKSKNIQVGLPPSERYRFTPLARHNTKISSIVILVGCSISCPHYRFIRQFDLGSREVFHALSQGKLEFNIPFFHVNHCANGTQKWSTSIIGQDGLQSISRTIESMGT